jgi:hypothetical protein
MSRPGTDDAIAAERISVIERMISSLQAEENRQYYVGLVGYYIEGIPYSASGLSVDSNATPDIDQTDAGFSCTAMFEPNLLDPSTVQKNGVVELDIGGQIKHVVRVRMEVMFDDIWCVAEYINGVQHDLFQDPGTLYSRLEKFSNKPH